MENVNGSGIKSKQTNTFLLALGCCINKWHFFLFLLFDRFSLVLLLTSNSGCDGVFYSFNGILGLFLRQLGSLFGYMTDRKESRYGQHMKSQKDHYRSNLDFSSSG